MRHRGMKGSPQPSTLEPGFQEAQGLGSTRAQRLRASGLGMFKAGPRAGRLGNASGIQGVRIQRLGCFRAFDVVLKPEDA